MECGGGSKEALLDETESLTARVRGVNSPSGRTPGLYSGIHGRIRATRARYVVANDWLLKGINSLGLLNTPWYNTNAFDDLPGFSQMGHLQEEGHAQEDNVGFVLFEETEKLSDHLLLCNRL